MFSLHRSHRRQRGFTLVEVVIAAVIVAILAAVTVPTVDGMINQQHAVDTIKMLDAITAAINPNTTTGTFRNIVAKYPGSISQLTNPLTTTLKNSCNRAITQDNYTAANVTAWAAIYPAVYYDIQSGTGAVTPFGPNLQDKVVRLNPAGFAEVTLTGTSETALTPVAATHVAVKIPNVELSDAQLLDQVKDASDGAASGTIIWLPATASGASTLVSVYYIIARSVTTC